MAISIAWSGKKLQTRGVLYTFMTSHPLIGKNAFSEDMTRQKVGPLLVKLSLHL